MTTNNTLLRILLLAALTLTVTACSGVRTRLMRTGVQSVVNDYFADGVWRLDSLGDGVFSYRMGFDRNLIVETTAGLVVVDPFNVPAAEKLAAVLAQRWPGQPVHTLIYSHHHLDHVRGGALLKPAEVVAHRGCERYWKDMDRRDILPPTRTIEGDTELTVGGVTIRLLDLGKSHSDSLYAVYLPQKRVLYGADLVFPNALPPLGMPDIYLPGFVAALDRLSAVDFQTYVPSHFDVGTKRDFLAGRDLWRDAVRLTKQHAGEGRLLADDPERFNAAFDKVFAELSPRYASWHGGAPMLLFLVQRVFVGTALGF